MEAGSSKRRLVLSRETISRLAESMPDVVGGMSVDSQCQTCDSNCPTCQFYTCPCTTKIADTDEANTCRGETICIC
jgi:hypothetical protein